MEPGSKAWRFGSGGDTFVDPVIACAVLVATVFILTLPRKHVICALLPAAFLIPMDQVVVIGTFHFQMLRILISFAWVKLLLVKYSTKNDGPAPGMNAIDKAVLFYAGSSVIGFTLLWQEWSAFINHMGLFYTVAGSYFALRFFVRDEEDVERTIRVLAVVAAVLASIMVVEQAIGWNPYAVFGGSMQAVRNELLSREGKFRAFASFGHAILAGTFGATLLPLFIAMWWKRGTIIGAPLVGIVASTVIVVASVSSTPILAYVAGLFALCLWPLRNRMRPLRWGIVLILISLHLVMKAPVWALIARVDISGGSSGWHRFYLVDQFVRKFEEWWLLGTKSNAEWGFTMWDVANQYVGIGQDAGIVPFTCFLAVIVFSFKYLGIARKSLESNKNQGLFFWALGAALFSHVIAFFGISYFDQTQVAWYALLAIISASTYTTLRSPVPQAIEPTVFEGPWTPDYAQTPSSPPTDRVSPQGFSVMKRS